MTEMTDEKRFNRNRIRWFPFIAALLGAPTLVAFLGIWMLFIPVYAAVLGAPTYLLFGAPAFYLAIRNGADSPIMHMTAGLLAHVVSIPALLLYFGSGQHGLNSAEVLIKFGFVFAPLWGLTFGLLYRWFCNLGRSER